MNHKFTAALTGLTLGLLSLNSARAETAPQIIPLYEGVAPGSEGLTQKEGSMDLNDTRFTPPNPDTLVWNVTKPTLAVLNRRLARQTGAAVIVAPGSGFRVLSYKTKDCAWRSGSPTTASPLSFWKYRLHQMPDDPARCARAMDQMLARRRAPAG